MSSTTTAFENPGGKVTFPRVVRSEWIKFWSLRSTYWTLLAAIVLVIGLGALISWGFASSWDRASEADRLAFDPTSISESGGLLAQMAIGVLGVLIISGEYSTGMIRASLAAVPARVPVILAKVLIYAVVALIVMTLASFVAFFIGQAIFSTKDIGVGIGDPHVLRAVLGGAIYYALVGVLGVALGALLRNTAGSIAVLFAVLLVLPIIGALLPGHWGDTVSKYLPSNAGTSITNVVRSANSLGPWTGLAVFVAYIVVALIAASILVKRRDA